MTKICPECKSLAHYNSYFQTYICSKPFCTWMENMLPTNVKKVGKFGYILIPAEIRRTLGIEEDDYYEFNIDDARIILKKYERACIFCGNTDDVQHYQGKLVCKECTANLFESAKSEGGENYYNSKYQMT